MEQRPMGESDHSSKVIDLQVWRNQTKPLSSVEKRLQDRSLKKMERNAAPGASRYRGQKAIVSGLCSGPGLWSGTKVKSNVMEPWLLDEPTFLAC
jgi:hypothetical protein